MWQGTGVGGARATGGGNNGGGGDVFVLAATRADVALDCGKGRGIADAMTAMTTRTTRKQALAEATTTIARCPSPERQRIVGPSRKLRRKRAFGGRQCRGNEIRLHSHLGECFAGDWAINKNHHMLLGQRFVWVTDCYATRFILLYDGNNPAVFQLQMRLMCWDVDITHQNNFHLTDADYWSRLGADICFDPLFKSYLDFDRGLRERFPVPTSLPMKLKNMPYYRGPRITAMADSCISGIPSTAPTNNAAHQSHCQFVMTNAKNGSKKLKRF